MSVNIKINYNEAKDRFELDVPYVLAGIAKRIPSRRWNKASRLWFVPAVRANVEHMTKSIFPLVSCDVSEAAQKAAASILNKAQRLVTRALPDWYEPLMPMRSYQRACCDMFYGRNVGGIFACMGSGKTKMVIDILCAKSLTPDEGLDKIDTVLVACPFSIRNNWLKELGKHCSVPYVAQVLDTKTRSGSAQMMSMMRNHDTTLRFLIVGIESLSVGSALSASDAFVQSGVAAVVVDELSKIKTPGAKRTKNIINIGRKAKVRFGLTGTPVTQGLQDLYSQMEFLSNDIIGYADFYSFRNRYMVMGGYDNRQIIGYDNAEELMSSINPHVFQITQAEALPELPERTYVTREVDLTDEQKRLYNDISKNKLITTSDTPVSVKNALEQLMRLQQVTGGFSVTADSDALTGKIDQTPVVLGSNKLTEVLAIADESAASIIIWARFKPELSSIAAALRGRYGDDAVVEFHGGISAEDRWLNVQKFESKKARFFVGNQATGGMGIDLLAATVVIYYSNTFSLEDREQTEARNFRMGQKNSVLYIDLLCAGTVDNDIVETLRDKKNVADWVRESLGS